MPCTHCVVTHIRDCASPADECCRWSHRKLKLVRMLAPSQVKHILLGDCIAAMRFCLECDKQYHKASFQIGRALTAQGWSEEAVQQLQGLFSARNRFSINIWEIQGGSQAKVLLLPCRHVNPALCVSTSNGNQECSTMQCCRME